MKNLMKKAVATAVIAASAGAAMAEISGSAQVDSMYLWRGQDIGGAQVSGSLDYSHDSGLYVGAWTTSAQEADYYAGFANEVGSFSYDLGYVAYDYWDGSAGQNGNGSADDQDLQEFYAIFGVADFGLEVWKGVGVYGKGKPNERNYNKDLYVAFSYSLDKLSATVGTFHGNYKTQADGHIEDDYTHVDISYAVNDNFSFTASKVVSADEFSAVVNADDLKLNASYSFDF